MRKIIFCFALTGLVSCSHRDLKNERADDVEQTFLYNGTEGNFIINKEEVFQTTNSQTNGKTTTLTGYSEYRLSSYDVTNGTMTGRVEMGEGIEKAFRVLGTSPGKLWVYSLDPDLGFHCRDPKTLAVLKNEKTLIADGALKGFQFAQPDWTKLGDYYGWNVSNSSIIVTNMTGFHYYFDPEKNSLTQTEDEIPKYTLNAEYLQATAYFNANDHVSMTGDIRKKLLWNDVDSTGILEYIDPQFIVDNDPVRELNRKQVIIDSLTHRRQEIDDTLNTIYRDYPVLRNDVMMFNAKTLEEIQMKRKVRDFQRETDDARRETERLERQWKPLYEMPALSDSTGDIFIVHANNVSDTSGMFVTKLHITDTLFTELWTVRLPGFYRHPQKANSIGGFGSTFENGNPDFAYKWMDIVDDKLIILSQLEMICLDIHSGKVLWQKPL